MGVRPWSTATRPGGCCPIASRLPVTKENTMASRSETGAVYAAAIIQGVALVTFPAASTIFTSPSYYDLSHTAYGSMFVPQAIAAIAASVLGAGLTRRWGIKRIY